MYPTPCCLVLVYGIGTGVLSGVAVGVAGKGAITSISRQETHDMLSVVTTLTKRTDCIGLGGE